MKLIIDIPDDIYRRLKAGDTNAGNTFHNTALEAIANGTPYEEKPQGEWVTKGYEPFGRCTVCDGICEVNNYCGHCGARMRGDKE